MVVSTDPPGLLEGAFEHFPDAALVVADDGTIVRLNERAAALYGVDEREVVGTHADTLLADGAVDAMLAAGERREREAERLRAGEGTTIIDRELVPIREGGEVAGGLVIAREVTDAVEQRRREEAIESYQELVLGHRQEELSRLADGDLTVEPALPDPEADFEEMQATYEAFRTTKEHLDRAFASLRELVALIDDHSRELADHSGALSGASTDVTDRIERIREATDAIAGDATTLAEGTDEARDSLSELTAAIEEISATAQQIDRRSAEATERTDEGAEAVSVAVERMEAVVASVNEIAEDVADLEERMADVGAITDVIADIAEQTNMLALNANIEAARTGADGEGFAVVADEIKQLAEDAQDSADDIATIVEGLQAETTTIASDIDDSADEIETAAESVRAIDDVLAEIQTAVRETSTGVAEVSDAVEAQSSNADSLHARVQEHAEVSQQVSASARQIADGVDGQSDAMAEVSEIAGRIETTATDLQAAIDRFTVEEDA